MAAERLTVAGRQFRTQADYEAALRDEKKIGRIKSQTNLQDPVQIYELFGELQAGIYRFETAVGNDFDDEIYELVDGLKKRGITAENAASIKSVKSGKHGKAGKSKKPENLKMTGKSQKAGKNAKSSNEKSAWPYAERNENEHLFEKSTETRFSQKNSKETDPALQKQIELELKKREHRRKWIVAVASLVAIGCFAYFGVYSYQSARTSMDYDALSELKGSRSLVTKNSSKNTLSLHKTSVVLPDVLDEYKTLYEKNKKLIGWLKIDDTIIDYPVMQTSDNEYYLEHNFNQEYDKNGSLFLDYSCSVYPRSTNLIIYGHHMKSGQMFGQLQKYARESYYEKHQTIQFDTIYEKGTYEVMYVFRSQVYNEDDLVFKYYQFINANSETEFDSYMEEMSAMSLYDTGVTATCGDSLLTLSTCDNSQKDGRFVVVAKKV